MKTQDPRLPTFCIPPAHTTHERQSQESITNSAWRDSYLTRQAEQIPADLLILASVVYTQQYTLHN